MKLCEVFEINCELKTDDPQPVSKKQFGKVKSSQKNLAMILEFRESTIP